MRYYFSAVCILLATLALTACSNEGESQPALKTPAPVVGETVKAPGLEPRIKPMPGAVPSTEVLPSPPQEQDSSLDSASALP